MYYMYHLSSVNQDAYYIGITSNMKSRLNSHKRSAKSGRKSLLYDSMRAYGIDSYEMIRMAEFETWQEACEREKETLAEARAAGHILLNLADGGEGGYVVPDSIKDEWRKKLSEARQGRKPALGMKHSEENKKIFSECGKKRWEGKTYPPEVIDIPFQESHELHGISKTHYYRLLKQAKTNDLG